MNGRTRSPRGNLPLLFPLRITEKYKYFKRSTYTDWNASEKLETRGETPTKSQIGQNNLAGKIHLKARVYVKRCGPGGYQSVVEGAKKSGV